MVTQSGQWTVVNGWCLTWGSVTSGAALKCLFGAGLFLTFIRDQEAEGTLSKFKDGDKLGGAFEKLGGRAAVQKVLERLEKWADRDLVKLSKTKCQSGPLRQRTPCGGTGCGQTDWGQPWGKGPGAWWAASWAPHSNGGQQRPGRYEQEHGQTTWWEQLSPSAQLSLDHMWVPHSALDSPVQVKYYLCRVRPLEGMLGVGGWVRVAHEGNLKGQDLLSLAVSKLWGLSQPLSCIYI